MRTPGGEITTRGPTRERVTSAANPHHALRRVGDRYGDYGGRQSATRRQWPAGHFCFRVKAEPWAPNSLSGPSRGNTDGEGGSASPNGNPPDDQAATGTSRGGRLIDRNLPYSCEPWRCDTQARARYCGQCRRRSSKISSVAHTPGSTKPNQTPLASTSSPPWTSTTATPFM